MDEFTPHGLRHGHKTWMAEDGIPEVLPADRLGHIVPGIRGVYTHVSDAMWEELKTKLQRRWERALDERAEIASGIAASGPVRTPGREAGQAGNSGLPAKRLTSGRGAVVRTDHRAFCYAE